MFNFISSLASVVFWIWIVLLVLRLRAKQRNPNKYQQWRKWSNYSIIAFGILVVISIPFGVANENMNKGSDSSSHSQTSSEKKMSSVKKWAKDNHISIHKQKESSNIDKSNSSDSKNSSDKSSVSDFTQALNARFGQDNAAVGAETTGDKDKLTIIVRGWKSWDNINVNSNKFYDIQQKVIHDVESLTGKYGINDQNISYTWNNFDGKLMVKD